MEQQNVFFFWEGRPTLHKGHFNSISSALVHHPAAKVSIYSNSLDANHVLAPYPRSRGFVVELVRYNCTALSLGYPGADQGLLLQAAIDAVFQSTRVSEDQLPSQATWNAIGRKVTGHKAFLTLLSEWMRYFLVFRFGGLYLDFDMIVLRPLLVPALQNRMGVDYAGDSHSFSCLEGLGKDPFRDRNGRLFTCVCNCLLLFERQHPLLERTLRLMQPMLMTYVAHRSFDTMRHYTMSTRVLMKAAGGEVKSISGATTPMVQTFTQVDTHILTCQNKSLRKYWYTPFRAAKGRTHAEMIISHCFVYHAGWRGMDNVTSSLEGTVGQHVTSLMTNLPNNNYKGGP